MPQPVTQSRVTQPQSSQHCPSLSFTHRPPQQISRKMFHLNFNLSSSTSLKRIQQKQRCDFSRQSSNLEERKDSSVDTNERKCDLKQKDRSKDSKGSRETVKKNGKMERVVGSGGGKKLLNHNKDQKMPIGEWIRPKHLQPKQGNQRQTLPTAPKQKVSPNQQVSPLALQIQLNNLNKTQQQPSKQLTLISPNICSRNNAFYILDEDQDFINPDQLKVLHNDQLQLRSIIDQKPTLAQEEHSTTIELPNRITPNSCFESPPIQPSSKTNLQKTNKPTTKIIKRTDSLVSIESVKSCESPTIYKRRLSSINLSRYTNMGMSSQLDKKREKRYSKFKEVISQGDRNNEKSKQEQLKLEKKEKRLSATIRLGSQRLSTRQQDNNKLSQSQSIPSFSPTFNRSANPPAQFPTPSSSSSFLAFPPSPSQQLPPSHYSITSPNSYLQKYQQLTSSPQQFIQSLKQLKQVEQDQEHEYFRFQKLMNKMVYYDKGKKNKQQQSATKNHRISEETPKNRYDPNKRNHQAIVSSSNDTTNRCLSSDEGKGYHDKTKNRRVSYNHFVQNLKNKPCSSKETVTMSLDMLTPNGPKDLNHPIVQYFPQTIVQARVESSLSSSNPLTSLQSSKEQPSPVTYKELHNPKNPAPLLQQPMISPMISPTSQSLQQIPSQQSTLFSLMFRKKDQQLQRMKQKLERVKSLEDQLQRENTKINEEFDLKWKIRRGQEIGQ